MSKVNRKPKTAADSAASEPRSAAVQSEARRLGRRLTLRFLGSERPELDRIEFKFKESSGVAYCQRGDEQSPLNWRDVADALSLCFLDYVCWSLQKSNGPFFFAGERTSSQAAKLGDATYQPKHALNGLFAEVILKPTLTGMSKSESSVINSVFGGDNRAGKNKTRGRRISIKSTFLPPDCLEVFWDCRGSDALTELGDVQLLATRIRYSLGLPTQKMPSLHEPVSDKPVASPPPAPHPTIDDGLFLDYLTGVGFAQWLGSKDEWVKTIHDGKKWLKKNPEDFYCRGMLLWSVLNKGDPSEMIKILNETAGWLVSSRPVPSNLDVQFNAQAWRQKIDRKIHQPNSDTREYRMFVRGHVEDTLVRAALMRYLRFQAAGSQLEREFETSEKGCLSC